MGSREKRSPIGRKTDVGDEIGRKQRGMLSFANLKIFSITDIDGHIARPLSAAGRYIASAKILLVVHHASTYAHPADIATHYRYRCDT